ncbi:MAG: hypothetical protein WC796_00525 [Candidatus Pacearchaeota archaeon]|jgi:hypothetical protein
MDEEITKIEENAEDLEKKKALEEKQSTQLKWVIGITFAIIIIIVLTVWVKGEASKFDYGGMHFQEELFGGKIPIYTTQITGYNTKGLPINFKLILRNNPKKLGVPVVENISFKQSGNVYVSINESSGFGDCANASISLLSLGQFFGNLGVKASGGVNPFNDSIKKNQTFVDCSSHPSNTVLLLTNGNETKIERAKSNSNCYVLTFKNCETMQVVERFEVAILAQSGGSSV